MNVVILEDVQHYVVVSVPLFDCVRVVVYLADPRLVTLYPIQERQVKYGKSTQLVVVSVFKIRETHTLRQGERGGDHDGQSFPTMS